MKTRNNLVSNSSSTSFIIAYKTSNKCPTCGRSDHDLADMFESWGKNGFDSDATTLEAKGLDAVKDHLNDEYHAWSPECEEEILGRIERFLEQHTGEEWEIMAGQVSYHDEIAKDLIREKEANGTLIKIWNDHE